MGRYGPLCDFLAGRLGTVVQVRMTVAEVEALVGPLPASAREYRAWWADDSKFEARAWRAAGWPVHAVNQTAEWVVFARGRVGGTHNPRPAAVGGDVPVGQLTIQPAGGTAARTGGLRTVPPPSRSDGGVTEAAVQVALVAHLMGEGWTVLRTADTPAREQGIDVLATPGRSHPRGRGEGLPGRRSVDPRRADQAKPEPRRPPRPATGTPGSSSKR